MSAPNNLPPLLSGRYRVLRQLGEGGMGVVYLARDQTLECEVVIKMPLRSALAEPGFADRFAREIRSMVLLTHPHVVKIQDGGNHEGVPFCVMQYLSGGSLQDRPRPADPATLRDWLPAVASALDFVHCQGFLHRDVKPANILFDGHGNAYISDFGVAKVLSDKTAQPGMTPLTGEGMVVGTVGYLAPELILGASKVDGKADQYALATTVYQVLAGRLPFAGSTPSAILVQQAAGKLPPLRQFAPHVPPPTAEAIERALSKNPARRYPDCSAFAEAVLRPASAGGTAPRPASSQMPKRPRTTGGTVSPASSKDARAAPARLAGREAGGVVAVSPTGRGRRQERTGAPMAGRGWVTLLGATAVLLIGAVIGGVFLLQVLRHRAGQWPTAQDGAEAFHFKLPSEIPVRPGTSTALAIRIVRIGYEGPVRLTCADRVPGVSLSEGTIGRGQSEATLRLEVADGVKSSLTVPLKGVGDGVEQSAVLPLRILSPPELKVQLSTASVTLHPDADAVSLRVQVLRMGCDEQTARFSVNTDSVPSGVLVVPTHGEIPPRQEGFEIRVKASSNSLPGGRYRLPIAVVLNQPGRKLEQEVVLELRVESSPR